MKSRPEGEGGKWEIHRVSVFRGEELEEQSVGKRRFHPKGIFSPRSPLGPTQPSWRGNPRRFRAWKGKEVGVSPVSQTQSSDIGSGLDFPALGQNREFSGLWMCLPKGMNVPCDIGKREFLELFTHHQEFSGKEKQKKIPPIPVLGITARTQNSSRGI